MATDIEKAPAELQQLVAEADTGGRKPVGVTATLIFGVALAWSLFQLWYASPLPFALRFGVLNDTEARSLHLAFALFLAFLALARVQALAARPRPARTTGCSRSPARSPAPTCSCSTASSRRAPASRRRSDIVVAIVGIVLLLEATRRAVGCADGGPRRAVPRATACSGRTCPSVIAHKGASLCAAAVAHVAHDRGRVRRRARRVDRHIFLFVLFGALLDAPAPATT